MNANEFLSMDVGQDDRLSELSGCLPCSFEVCHGLLKTVSEFLTHEESTETATDSLGGSESEGEGHDQSA